MNSKLKLRCRRGMKELDVLLTRYLSRRYEHAPIAEQQTFQALLKLPDMDLYAYLLGQKTPMDEKMRNWIKKTCDGNNKNDIMDCDKCCRVGKGSF